MKSSFAIMLAMAVLCGSARCGAAEQATPEDEAHAFLRGNRSLVVAAANGRTLVEALISKRTAGEGEPCNVFADAFSFLSGKEVAIKGSMVGVSKRTFSMSKYKASITIGSVRQQPVNITCHINDAAVGAFSAISVGQPVFLRGRLCGSFNFLDELAIEDAALVDGKSFRRTLEILPAVEDELLGDCFVMPRPFADLDGSVKRDLVEMSRCAEAAYPETAIPGGYRPLSREEWRSAVEVAGYADEVYSDDGYVILGNGLRGRLMAHRLTGRTVVAWSGCDLREGGLSAAGGLDFLACAKHLLDGDVNSQFTQAAAITKGILNTRPGKVWIVGHSLGGCLATYSTLTLGKDEDRVQCATFNALGISSALCQGQDCAVRSRAAKRIANVYCTEDPVYTGHRLLSWIKLIPMHIGRSYFLEYASPTSGPDGQSDLGQIAELEYHHGISELRSHMEAQTPSVMEEPLCWGVIASGFVLLGALAAGLVLLRKKRAK